MRKFYTFLAGALLLTLPVASQTGPERNPATDPKVVFHQDFEVEDGLTAEQAYQEWSTTPVGYIKELEYYAKIGTSTASGVNIYTDKTGDYNVFAIRKDSTTTGYPAGTGIVLLNGVETTSSETDKKNGTFDKDQYTIVSDGGNDNDRNKAFDEYGEDGGKYYFRYITSDLSQSGLSSSHYSSSTRSTKNYRRDLFVRGFNIEDQTSYRLTMYVKTTKLPGSNNNPIFYADVMRGYHHVRKGFSMGIETSKVFEFKKEDFNDGQWEKVTLMTYYLNDSIADGFLYYDKFEWADDWRWRPSDAELAAIGKTLKEGDSLNYIKSPDEYFVRLAFVTDSVEYLLDNMSLTKSWIGGIQHADDMLRVDFGYQTNLKDLAKAAKEKTKIASVELPGNFFTVWGKEGDTWKKVEINSAEYHDDGYMYMWTKPRKVGNTQRAVYFNSFDSVLVSFTNPDADSIKLVYNGDLYPNALDEAWVAAGKKVFDFNNEFSTPNPTIKEGVYSMKNLPPVFQGTKYENGSFGLPADLSSITLNLSKKVEFDPNEDGSGNKAFCQVFKDGVLVEIWPVSESTDTYTTFERKNTSTPLSGDYTFKFKQLKNVATTFGDDVELTYHFGNFSKEVNVIQIDSDWRGELPTFNTSDKGCNPASTYVHDSDATSTFRKGINSGSSRAKSRLYSLGYPAGDPDNCGYILITRSSSTGAGKTANVYTVVHFDQAGDCKIQFKATGWNVANIPGYLYFYEKPDQELADGNDNGFAILESCEKTELGTFTPADFVSAGDVEDKGTGKWPETVKTFTFNFTVPKAGDYMFEWVTKTGNKNGVMIGNYSISSANAGDLSTKYVKKINDAYDKAVAIKAEVDGSTRKYKGAIYNAFVKYMSTFKEDAFKETAPSVYDANAAAMNSAVNQMQARIDTVDMFYTALNDVDSVLAADKADYETVEAYRSLNTLKVLGDLYDCSEHESQDIAKTVSLLYDGIDNLDTRIGKTAGFNDLLSSTKEILDSAYVLFDGDLKLEGKDMSQYDGLNQVYESAVAQKDNLATLTDNELNTLYDGMVDSAKAYIFGMDAVVAYTRQVRELFALADSLGYDFGGKKDSIKALISEQRTRNEAAEDLLRAAVTLQIYKKFANGETIDSLDVSCLIPNYYLYNEAQIDRDVEKNSSGNWRIKRKANNTTIIPGWNLSPSTSSGNWYITKAKVGDAYVMGSYTDWEADGHVFIGGLRSATSTKGVLKTTITGLPEANYLIGLYAYNQTSDLVYKFKTDSEELTGKVNADMNGGSKFTFKKVGIDSVLVAGNLEYTIDQQSSSSGEFDMREAVLVLRFKSETAKYADLVAAQEEKLAGMITFVPEVAAKAIAVQYFNLNGVQIAAPESGKIVIRRTILSNGKSQVEKILVK